MSRCWRAEMKPGISIPTGQPGTQRGFLQRRQRSASCSAPSRSRPRATSSKLWTRASARLVRHGGALGRDGPDVLGQRGPGGWAIGLRQFAGGGHAAVPLRSALEAGQLGRFVAVPLQRGLLFALEALLAQRQLVEIHQVAVEIGAIHAGELHLAADRDAARSAHAGAVHHDRVQADDGGDAERAGDFAAGLHHRDGPDGDHFADVLFVSAGPRRGRG